MAILQDSENTIYNLVVKENAKIIILLKICFYKFICIDNFTNFDHTAGPSTNLTAGTNAKYPIPHT
ncbi:MAG: hypothetical protein PVJ84_20150, partial [Desulfobacteraceae bacterium]